MGNVLLVYKIIPEEQENMDQIEADLKAIDCAKVQEIKREPHVFGMKYIRASFIIPDKVDGAAEKVEEYIAKVKNISSFDNIVTTLAS